MNERAARCLLLARVLAADGFMTDVERATLREAMDRHGLDEHDRAIVSDMDRLAEAEAVVRALPEAARRELVDDLVLAALADGKLSPHETRVVGEISAAIGLS